VTEINISDAAAAAKIECVIRNKLCSNMARKAGAASKMIAKVPSGPKLVPQSRMDVCSMADIRTPVSRESKK
jgi:hypothetical protein